MTIEVEDGDLDTMVAELRELLERWVGRGVPAGRALAMVFLTSTRCMCEARYSAGELLSSLARTWTQGNGRW